MNKLFLFFIMTIICVNAYGETDWNKVIGTTTGAIVGGAIGSQVGKGSGRYVGTAVGTMTGAIIGNQAAGGEGFDFSEEEPYEPEYGYDQQGNIYYSGGEDDYMIKQRLSDAAKRRNMIRNGEIVE